MSHIRLIGITKRFGDVIAVNNLNLEIAKGECFSMLGPSGCGKTTTLRMVAGFEDIDEGEIHVGNRLLSSHIKNFYLPPEKRDFGMVFQAFAVWPHLSVFENVAFPLRLRKLSATEIKQRTEDALKHTNLLNAANQSPMDLSGGGKQRVALARALALNPDVMLLDEPLSSLDPHLREEMRFEIKELQKKFGFSILYVTHDQSEAMALSDRIMVMRQGVVEQIDTPLNVYRKPSNKFVFSFIGLSNFIEVEKHGDGLRVMGSNDPLKLEAPGNVFANSPKAVLATRPAEIEFSDGGQMRGTVKRRTYLGEIVDYAVTVGDQELRIQKNARKPGPKMGETCGLLLTNPHWYPAE